MKEKSTRHRDAIDKVAEAVDHALVSLVRIIDDDRPDFDNVLIQLAEARAYIVQAMGQAHAADVVETISIVYENDQPRVYADEVRPIDNRIGDNFGKPKLPKLKPQGHAKDDKPKYKPGITKLLKGAKQFACPTCDAEAGTNCFKYEGPGAHPKRTNERNDGHFHHRKRQDIAAAYNKRIKAQNILH